MTYDQENFWCIPQTMHSLAIIWKLLIVIWDYVIACECFLAKANLIHMLYPNVYSCFISAQW
jgi:hypothetical protein